jgi:hypothetical protein
MPGMLNLAYRSALLAAIVLLAGCAARAPLPNVSPTLELPQQLLVQRRAADADSDWLLVIQDDAGALRFTLLDPLGVPLARQRLLDGDWHSEGLLPPNPQARELFAAVLFALTPTGQLSRFYPDAVYQTDSRQLLQRGQPRWQLHYGDAGAFRLQLPADVEYQITPLTGESAR